MPNPHGFPVLGCIGGQQAFRRLLGTAIPGVVDVIEGAELSAEGITGELGLTPALGCDRHVVVSNSLDRLPRLVVEEERVALLCDVSRRLRVAHENQKRGTFASHRADTLLESAHMMCAGRSSDSATSGTGRARCDLVSLTAEDRDPEPPKGSLLDFQKKRSVIAPAESLTSDGAAAVLYSEMNL